jgi:hypothetical protein
MRSYIHRFGAKITAIIIFFVVICCVALYLFFRTEKRIDALTNINIGISGASASVTIEGPGFESSDDAVLAYLDGMKNANLGQMLSSFAIESFVDNYDIASDLKHTRWYPSNPILRFPNSNQFFREMNISYRREKISNGIYWQFISLCTSDINFSEKIPFDDDSQISEFLDKLTGDDFSPQKLQTLKFLNFVPLDTLSKFYYTRRNMDHLARRAKAFGISEIRSVVARIEIENQQHILCLDTGLYDNKWRNLNLVGNIGVLLGLDPLSGGLAPFPFEER